ncbi:electron transfer flavoprotein subunit alpha/FixB family protein [Marinobacter sp.]|uniref:electron transfer flavoprotein subunit alpha n=1 Tax=Marinobacter sp. TaxID=50741 RepID=UPI00384FFD0B
MHNDTGSLPRRDPRWEWIARNRLHPLHEETLAGPVTDSTEAHVWQGPNGLIRRDPHKVGFVGISGLKRIDRSGAQGGTTANQRGGRKAAPADARKSVVIENPAFLITVVPDLPGGRLCAHDRDLFGLARQLADANPDRPGAVLAVVFDELREDGFGDAGVDRLLHYEDRSAASREARAYAPETRLGVLTHIERELLPDHWLFPDSAMGGAELGRRLAAKLGERPATQVWQIEDNGTELRCTGRGAAGVTDISRPLPRIVLALPECAEPVARTRHAAQPLSLSPGQGLAWLPGRIQNLGAVAVDPAQVALSESEFILSAGRGVRDWEGFHKAAEVLGATEGASRVAVDDGFMTRDRQVGASGTWVSARVYIAVGISGAIQHLQGIQSCDKVVSINLDPDCDIIKRADLAVIGDAAQVLAALVALQQKESRSHAA